MRNFLKLAEGINVQPLLLSIYRQPEYWATNTFRTAFPGSPHAKADTIILRCQALDGSGEPRECVNCPAFAHFPEARRLVMGLMAQVEGERLGRVFVTRLKPGDDITPHVDIGPPPIWQEAVRYWGRYHLPLQTDTGAAFRCEEEVVHMAAGEVWYFRNDLEHEVFWTHVDPTTPDRLHLIVDIHSANEPVR